MLSRWNAEDCVRLHMQERLREAERERLARQVPRQRDGRLRRPWAVLRRWLASARVRLEEGPCAGAAPAACGAGCLAE